MTDTVDIACHKFRKEIRAGTTALRVLATVDGSIQPLYSAQITRRLTARGSTPVERASLHHALRSLEHQGLVASHNEPSPKGPARKYYSITPEGHHALIAWRVLWQQTKESVDSSLGRCRQDR